MFLPPVQEAARLFPQIFQDNIDYSGPLGAAWAPGRVNVIGEHTDYNDGYVLPLAVDRVAALAGRQRTDATVRLWSSHFHEYAQFLLEGLPETFEQQRTRLPDWARYVLGVATEMVRAGIVLQGFDAVVSGDVPLGGGMSSSAALGVATAYACALFSPDTLSIGTQGATFSPIQVALLCQKAEQTASGVMVGILDQAASCLGQAGKALLLDCRSLDYRYVPFDMPKLSVVVIDSGVRRELATSAYNERRQQCEEATTILRELILNNNTESVQAHEIKALRDITLEQFERYKGQLPTTLRQRASYILAENARVLQVSRLLEEGKYEQAGAILWQGHIGLRDDYEVSCVELDTLVEIAHQVPGVLGARMMGGGFGGCTINLVYNDAIEALHQAIEEQYQMRTGYQAKIESCRAGGGPHYQSVDIVKGSEKKNVEPTPSSDLK
jgi:galactokinase